MTDLPDIAPGVAGLQTRLVVETIAQVVTGAEIVDIVGSLDETVPGFAAESWSRPGLEHALSHIRKRVVGQLGAGSGLASFSCVISSVAWGVLVEPIQLQRRHPHRSAGRGAAGSSLVEPGAFPHQGLRRSVEPHRDPGRP